MFEPQEAPRGSYLGEYDVMSHNHRAVSGLPHVTQLAEDAATRSSAVNAPPGSFSTTFAEAVSGVNGTPGWGAHVGEVEVLWTADSTGEEEEGMHASSAGDDDEDMALPSTCTSLSDADLEECSGSFGDLSALHSNDSGSMAGPRASPSCSSRRLNSSERPLPTESTNPQRSAIPLQAGVLGSRSQPHANVMADNSDAAGALQCLTVDETTHDGNSSGSATENGKEAVTQLHHSVGPTDDIPSMKTTCLVTPDRPTARKTWAQWDSTSTERPPEASAHSCSRVGGSWCEESGGGEQGGSPPRHLTFTHDVICIGNSNNTFPQSFAFVSEETAAHGDTTPQQLCGSRPGASACPGLPTRSTPLVPNQVPRQQCASNNGGSDHGSDTCDLVFDDDDQMQQPPWSGTQGCAEEELSLAPDASDMQDGPPKQDVIPGQGLQSCPVVEPSINVGSRTTGTTISSRTCEPLDYVCSCYPQV